MSDLFIVSVALLHCMHYRVILDGVIPSMIRCICVVYSFITSIVSGFCYRNYESMSHSLTIMISIMITVIIYHIRCHVETTLICFTPNLNTSSPLQWCHNECDGISNHRGLDCLFSCLFRHRSFVRWIHRWPVDFCLWLRRHYAVLSISFIGYH